MEMSLIGHLSGQGQSEIRSASAVQADDFTAAVLPL